MSDAPEKIWAGNDGFANRWDWEEPVTGWEEYTRTDIADAIIAALPDYDAQQARIKELEATLQEDREAKWTILEHPLKNRVAELESALLTIKDWEAGPSGKTSAEMYMRAVACEALKAKI